MAFGWLVCGVGVGCLVTDQIEFETDRNVPPMIFDVLDPPAEINGVVWINKAQSTMVKLKVKVRDENIAQPLEARWRLVSKDDPTPMHQTKDIRVTGEVVRELEFEVQTDFLREDGCARLDLAVSGSFSTRRNDDFDETTGEDQSDLDSVAWLIWEGEGQGRASMVERNRIAASCPTNENLLTPTLMEVTQ